MNKVEDYAHHVCLQVQRQDPWHWKCFLLNIWKKAFLFSSTTWNLSQFFSQILRWWWIERLYLIVVASYWYDCLKFINFLPCFIQNIPVSHKGRYFSFYKTIKLNLWRWMSKILVIVFRVENSIHLLSLQWILWRWMVKRIQMCYYYHSTMRYHCGHWRVAGYQQTHLISSYH